MNQVDVDEGLLDDPNPSVPEAARDAFLDMLLEHWPRIAALAWLGFQRVGRGTVTVRDGSMPPALAYRPGSPCRCHAEAVAAYDPVNEVVLAVVRPLSARVVWAHVLVGTPGPRAAARVVAGPLVGETVH